MTASPALAPVSAPLSPLQMHFWLLEQLGGGVPVFNVCVAVRLDGPLDAGALQDAFEALGRRHALLASVFTTGSDGIPELRTAGARASLRSRTVAAGTLREAAVAEALVPFVLEDALLWRALLLDEGDPDAHVLVLTLHHAITDGRSMAVLLEDLRIAYAAGRRGETPSWPRASIAYAQATASGAVSASDDAASLAFWRAELAGIGGPAAPDAGVQHRAITRQVECSARDRLTGADFARVMRFARERRVTPFTVLATATATSISAVTGRSEVLLGLPVENRGPEVERTVGPFADMTILRVRAAGAPFPEVLKDVQRGLVACLRHSDVSFARLVHEAAIPRVPGRRSVFDATISLRRAAVPVSAGGITWTAEDVELPVAPFDLAFEYVLGTAELGLMVGYDADAVTARTGARLCAGAASALRTAASC